MRPPSVCNSPGCPGYATYRGYCDAHKPQHTRPTNAAYIERSKFYNTAKWKRIRVRVLHREPLCRYCKDKGIITEATQVDHIIPRAEGGPATDLSNLQGLCGPCHSSKTQRENR